MDNVFKLIFIFFAFLCFSVDAHADTYPAVSVTTWGGYESLDKYCTAQITFVGWTYTLSETDANTCKIYSSTGAFVTDKNITPFVSLVCPHGGVKVGTTCVDAPACPEGQSRKSTGECYVGPICTPPETDIGDGICGVDECTGGKVLNGSTGQCQTPPTCAAAETYMNATNSCLLLPLRCPDHAHANFANDKCLPDAPLTCPAGQHDDGTYTCVANDAIACKSNQVKGYVFGIPQCIKKSNVNEAAKVSDDAFAAQTAAASIAAAAQSAADNAAAAAAADPSDTTLQAAAVDAAAAAAEKQKLLSDATKNADEAHKAQDSEALKSISESTKELADSNRADHDAGFGDVPSAEAINTTSFSASGLPSGSSFGTCPAPYQIHTSHGTIMMSYAAQCDFAQKISPLILTFAYLSAGLIVLGPIRD